MTVPAIAGVVGAVAKLFQPGVDPRIKADLDPAIQRGDVNYLIAWIQDQPPHPRDSIAYAQAHLAQAYAISQQLAANAQTYGGLQYGGRLSAPQIPPATPYSEPVNTYQPSGYIPLNTARGQIGIPYNG